MRARICIDRKGATVILTETETQELRQFMESQSGMDEELLRRTRHLLHLGAFDEAVRSAFVFLEERLRAATGKEGMTGTNLADFAFNAANGPLSKHLGRSLSERQGLRELYSGAFKLFRNPTAHGAVRYSSVEGKAVVSLVNLLLSILSRAEELPPPEMFPENVETMLHEIEQEVGPGAGSRVRLFIGKCIGLGLQPTLSGKQWIPFRRYALRLREGWDEPRPSRIAVFYLAKQAREHRIIFSTASYYAETVGFDVDALVDDLTGIGFRPSGKNREPHLILRTGNDQPLLDALFALVERTCAELEATLEETGQSDDDVET